ncbi:hypothetical protein BFS14_16830 [Serratia fonticola]|nr:hypothetical protein BFS14_16830 [Serratia fonticola]
MGMCLIIAKYALDLAVMDEIGLILMMASTNSCEQERSILSYSPHVCFSARSLQFYLSQRQEGFYSSYGARFFIRHAPSAAVGAGTVIS